VFDDAVEGLGHKSVCIRLLLALGLLGKGGATATEAANKASEAAKSAAYTASETATQVGAVQSGSAGR
jgi:hypothetical protein